jgi:hypothetical protein
MENDTVIRAGRFGALAAAPLAVASIVLVIVAESSGAMTSMASPIAVVASSVNLVATLGLLLGLVWLHLHTRDRMDGRGGAAMVVALLGAALAVGAAWSMVFPAPAFDARFPGLLSEPLPAVVGGYVVSHAILGVGTLLWAVAARRTGTLSKALSTVLIIGGLLCITPLPARYLLVAVGLTLIARRRTHQVAASPVTA